MPSRFSLCVRLISSTETPPSLSLSLSLSPPNISLIHFSTCHQLYRKNLILCQFTANSCHLYWLYILTVNFYDTDNLPPSTINSLHCQQFTLTTFTLTTDFNWNLDLQFTLKGFEKFFSYIHFLHITNCLVYLFTFSYFVCAQ